MVAMLVRIVLQCSSGKSKIKLNIVVILNTHKKYLRLLIVFSTVLVTVEVTGCRENVTTQSNTVLTVAPAEQQVTVDKPETTIKKSRRAAVIIRPGAVAVHAPVRRANLLDANALDMCLNNFWRMNPQILHVTNAPSGYGLDEQYNIVSNRFRQLGAACLAGNEAGCTAITDYALDWARNSELGRPAGHKHDGVYWNSTLTINMRLLSPMLSALGIAEQFTPLTPTDRDILNRWIRKKVDAYEHGMRSEGSYRGGSAGTTARKAAHNHAVQSSIVAMSYGAWANNEKYFKVGLSQWFITLKSMRKDGSLPIETRRGARALFYTGRTLSALVQLAERAAVQKIDLYQQAPSESKTIHHAVEFFINAVEQPDLVLKYARSNKYPGPNKNYKVQDLGGHASTLGWIAPYISRFPEHPNTRRLMARKNFKHTEPRNYLTYSLDQAVRANGYSSEWIGVDARCLYADPRLR